MSYFKKFAAEFLGTMLLVFFGCGVAMCIGVDSAAGLSTVALSFGFVLTVCIYIFGSISGCHINPAVSFGMLVAKRMNLRDFGIYLLAQFLGGIAGAGVLACIFKGGSLGSNGFGALSSVGDLSWYGAAIIEIILTFVFVFTVLSTTSRPENSKISGVINGIALTLVHFFGIIFTGTSVNPARSFGPALISLICGESAYLGQVWLFIVMPLIGGAIAAVVHMFFNGKDKCLKQE